jgi:hypothetical protein
MNATNGARICAERTDAKILSWWDPSAISWEPVDRQFPVFYPIKRFELGGLPIDKCDY